jgi:hypothetical protein
VAGQHTGRLALATPDFQLAAPQYLAPEQVEGREPDHRADIYALAVLAFELATGTPLHGTACPADVLRATLQHPGPSASARNPRLPGEVDAVFARALAKEPERRQSWVWELVEQLVDPPAATSAPPLPADLPVVADPVLLRLPPLDLAGVDGLVEDVGDGFFAACVRLGRHIAGDHWAQVVRLAELRAYLVDDPAERGMLVPELLALSRLAGALDIVYDDDAPRRLALWGNLVGRLLLRSIQEKPPWIAGPPTGRLVDLLSVFVETLDRIRGDELHAWKQVDRTQFRIVAEAECGCVTGTYDCVFSMVRASG